MMKLRVNKIILVFSLIVLVLASLPTLSAFEAHIVNVTARIQDNTPVADPLGGTYDEPISVSLTSAEAGADILYSLNGTPSCPATGILYTGPISINTNKTLRAVACGPRGSRSGVMEEVYKIPYPDNGNTIGLWHFNEGSGTTAFDDSSNNNHGTVYGANWSAGKFNGALDFDGVDDYVEVADSASLDITDKITIEFWIYLRDYSSAGGNGVTKEHSYKCGVYSGKKIVFRMTTTGGSWSSNALYGNTDVALNEWHHIAATYDSSTGEAKVFLDGVEDGSTTFSGAIISNDKSLWVGRGSSPFLNGLIDEVRISDVVRY